MYIRAYCISLKHHWDLGNHLNKYLSMYKFHYYYNQYLKYVMKLLKDHFIDIIHNKTHYDQEYHIDLFLYRFQGIHFAENHLCKCNLQLIRVCNPLIFDHMIPCNDHILDYIFHFLQTSHIFRNTIFQKNSSLPGHCFIGQCSSEMQIPFSSRLNPCLQKQP